MKKIIIIAALFFLSGCSAGNSKPLTVVKSYQATTAPEIISNKIYMKLVSPDFANNASLPLDLTCSGKGMAPVLQLADAPTSTISFALIVNDPDAPKGVFTHWLAWNFDKSTTTIDIKNLSKAVVIGINSSGAAKYVPPCPPSGLHHYYFRLYALDAKLDLSPKANEKQLEAAMRGHILDEAVLMGIFEHK
jgi:Raf kinase inhibitor-like YbhB/YbcL family protein